MNVNVTLAATGGAEIEASTTFVGRIAELGDRFTTMGAHVLRYSVVMVLGWIGALLFGAALTSQPTAAAPTCGVHIDIVKKFERLYAEKAQSIGLSRNGLLIEVLVSSTGSWTILATDQRHQTCAIAAGESWETLIVAATGPSV